MKRLTTSAIRLRAGTLMVVISGLCAGQAWTPHSVPSPGGGVNRVMFADDKTGWICAFFAGVLRTVDAGSNWSRLDSNLPAERIASVWFVSKSQGWAIGTSYAEQRSRPVILVSGDGGRSWTMQTRVEGRSARLVDIWFLDAQHGWAVGSRNGEGLILTTNDGGRRWEVQYQASDATTEVRRVRFANSRVGWAVGIYTVLRTDDGGKKWSPQYNSSDAWALNDLAVVSPEEAWVTGGWDFLLHTQDGGITWSRPLAPKPSGDFLWSVRFAGRNQGWLCGAQGALLSTRDAGVTWNREKSPVNRVLGDIFVTPSRVFVVADPSQVLFADR